MNKLISFAYYTPAYWPILFNMKLAGKCVMFQEHYNGLKQVNMLYLCIQLLKIDNITAECALIDFKQIERTIIFRKIGEILHRKSIQCQSDAAVNDSIRDDV